MTRYLEHVHSPRWVTGLVFATTIAMCLIGLWLLAVKGEVLAGLVLVGSAGGGGRRPAGGGRRGDPPPKIKDRTL